MNRLVTINRILLFQIERNGHSTSCHRCGHEFEIGDQAMRVRHQALGKPRLKLYCVGCFYSEPVAQESNESLIQEAEV